MIGKASVISGKKPGKGLVRYDASEIGAITIFVRRDISEATFADSI